MAERMDREIPVYEMLRIIGRAELAVGSVSSAEITNYLQRLGPQELVPKFHRAVVVLSSKGLLSQNEQIALTVYAQDWIHFQPLSTSE